MSVSTTNTPWGRTQTKREIALGIVRVSTSSHGGFVLNDERMAEFHGRLTINFQSWAGYAYLEEDYDWCAVALAFPEFFSEEDIYYAVLTAKGSHPELAPWFADTKQGREVAQTAEAFRLRRLDHWEVGCASTSGKGWRVSLRRLRDGAEKFVSFPDYPGDRFYSDADLSVLAA